MLFIVLVRNAIILRGTAKNVRYGKGVEIWTVGSKEASHGSKEDVMLVPYLITVVLISLAALKQIKVDVKLVDVFGTVPTN